MTTESDRELLSAITSLREWSIDMASRRARARANARPWETPVVHDYPNEPDDDQATGDASDGCGDGDEGDEDE